MGYPVGFPADDGSPSRFVPREVSEQARYRPISVSQNLAVVGRMLPLKAFAKVKGSRPTYWGA